MPQQPFNAPINDILQAIQMADAQYARMQQQKMGMGQLALQQQAGARAQETQPATLAHLKAQTEFVQQQIQTMKDKDAFFTSGGFQNIVNQQRASLKDATPDELAIYDAHVAKAQQEKSVAALSEGIDKIASARLIAQRQKEAMLSKPEPAVEDQRKYTGILIKQKVGKASPEELQWAAAYKQMRMEVPVATANVRMEALGRTKVVNMMDPVTKVVSAIHPNDLEDYSSKHPGAVLVSGSTPTQGMTKQALLDDIRGALGQVRDASKVLDTGLKNRAKVAAILADPNTSLMTFAQSPIAEQLSPEEQDYVTAILNAREQVMALRSVLGAGQSSEEQRRAIWKTIPNAMTPNSAFAGKQLDLALASIARLEKGIPKLQAGKPTEKKKDSLGILD